MENKKLNKTDLNTNEIVYLRKHLNKLQYLQGKRVDEGKTWTRAFRETSSQIVMLKNFLGIPLSEEDK